MRDTRLNNTDELKATMKETWTSITPQQCHRADGYVPCHIDVVIHAEETLSIKRWRMQDCNIQTGASYLSHQVLPWFLCGKNSKAEPLPSCNNDSHDDNNVIMRSNSNISFLFYCTDWLMLMIWGTMSSLYKQWPGRRQVGREELKNQWH